MKITSISFVAALGLFTLTSLAFSQEQTTDQPEARTDLSKYLSDKERRFLDDKGSVEDLTDEEIEHVQRIQRLQQLRAEEQQQVVIAEAAGADRPEEPQPVVEPEPARVTTPQEEATELARENAVLRSEIRRLRAQLRAIDRQNQELLYPEFDRYQPQPRFYVPVR